MAHKSAGLLRAQLCRSAYGRGASEADVQATGRLDRFGEPDHGSVPAKHAATELQIVEPGAALIADARPSKVALESLLETDPSNV